MAGSMPVGTIWVRDSGTRERGFLWGEWPQPDEPSYNSRAIRDEGRHHGGVPHPRYAIGFLAKDSEHPRLSATAGCVAAATEAPVAGVAPGGDLGTLPGVAEGGFRLRGGLDGLVVAPVIVPVRRSDAFVNRELVLSAGGAALIAVRVVLL